ncbi:MAG: T9SS type A sorting domain-containing protein [Flavobacteriales bacterium]
MKKHTLFTFLFFFSVLAAICQPNRKVVVLNMDDINNETNNSRHVAVIRLMRLTGVAFDTTSDFTTAFTYPIVITGSRILDNVLTTPQHNQFINYVTAGGVLLTSNMRDTALFNLSGISTSTNSSILCEIMFDTTFLPQLYHDIDDSLEVDISIGDTAGPSSFATRQYLLTTATSMANYENGTCALAYNTVGNGHVYTFGPDFRDISLRNQLDLDVNANRIYSNGFEPSTDVISFLVRNIVRRHIPNSVYKYTVPGQASSVFMITHDIDSDSGIDTMYMFSNYEVTKGIKAMYNITTRYTNDNWLTSFYIGSWSEVHALLADGHILASHSVGHFPDFDNETLFPLGTTGNTPAQYQPFYAAGITTGGTVMGEVEVSKELIEDDHTVVIRSFRAGHLCYNDSLILGLETMGYQFNSTHSANNILTSFPFYDMKVRSFSSSESTILEIPMTISDVFNSDPINSSNYIQKVNIWKNVCRKYNANHSPVSLLIHPNRVYKLTAQQMLVDSLPADMEFIGMEDYGNFWRKRDSLLYHTYVTADTLFVQMDNNTLAADQSFVIDMNGLDTARFFDVLGEELYFEWDTMPNGRRLYYPVAPPDYISENTVNQVEMHVYPNPTNGRIAIVTSENLPKGKIEVADMTGKVVYNENWLYGNRMLIDLGALSLHSGVYFLKYHSSEKVIVSRIIYTSPY